MSDRCNDDVVDWDALIDRLLGPVLSSRDRERRHAEALELAAAAMRAAEAIEAGRAPKLPVL